MGTTGIQIKMLQASILIKDFFVHASCSFHCLSRQKGDFAQLI